MAANKENKIKRRFKQFILAAKNNWIYISPALLVLFLWVSFSMVTTPNALPFYALVVVVLLFMLLCYDGFKLEPGKALYELPLFWVAALLPLYTGLYLGSFIWSFNWKLTGTAFNNFLETSKLPLGIMALGIPFGVMVGSFHRTLQTAEQISQVESERQDKELTAYRHALVIIKRVQGLVVYYEKITTRPNRIEKEKVSSVASKITSVFDSLYDQEYVRIFYALEEKLQAADAELISVITAGEAASNDISGIKEPINRYVRTEVVKLKGSLEDLYSTVKNKMEEIEKGLIRL